MNDLLRQTITDAVTPMEGWATPEKAIAMAELILAQNPRIVVEIGVFGGRSLIPQAMALRENNQGVIYGIDPWKLNYAIEGDVGQANADWNRDKVDWHYIHRCAAEAIWKHSLDDYVVLLRCPSQIAAKLFPVEHFNKTTGEVYRFGEIDILHIDGCHSELASCRDVEFYLPRVRRGGYIWFDDTDWEITKKAVKMLDVDCERIEAVGSCVLFKKVWRCTERISSSVHTESPFIRYEALPK